MTSGQEAIDLITKELLPMWQRERRKLDRIDKWARWDHDKPHRPRRATAEYRELSARAQAPWGDLIVRSVAQTLYVEGYGRADSPAPDAEPDPGGDPGADAPSDPAEAEGPDLSVPGALGWHIWQANGMDGRQVAVFISMLTYGLTYGLTLPGKTLTGEKLPVMRGVSPRDMIAVYEDPAFDDWPAYALRVAKVRGGYRLSLLDDEVEWVAKVSDLGSAPTGLTASEHGAGVVPVVRFKNRFDLEGRAVGEIEPFIPLLGRIDQTTFDRLVVQRFAAWIVRTIAGMSVTESAQASGESAEQVKLRLAVEDFLTAEDKDTKFGSLPATPLDGFIKAQDADKIDLAATTQTPAFELLGQLANISADGLQAVKSSQDAKSDEKKHTTGVDIEQWLRLGAWVYGDRTAAQDFRSQVRWADTSIRSLNGAADGLGKLSQMLGIPPQVLWTKVPTLTQQDIDEAKAIIARDGGLSQFFARLTNGVTPTPAPVPAAA